MTLQASRDVMHSARGFHKEAKLISHIRIAWMNSSPAELAVHLSNMKEQKLQTKDVCYPEQRWLFGFFFLFHAKAAGQK